MSIFNDQTSAEEASFKFEKEGKGKKRSTLDAIFPQIVLGV